MQKVNPKGIEMIRWREKAGFSYLNSSFLAERVDSVPSPDGLAKLARQDWWNVPSAMTGFVNAHNGQTPSVATKLRVVYDDETIFAAFYMEEPEMAKTSALVAEPGQREVKLYHPDTGKDMLAYSIVKDDSVLLCLDFSHSHRRYVRFFVNMAGVGYAEQAEYRYGTESVYPNAAHQEPWDREYRSAVAKGANYWLAAFEIPWASVGAKAADVRLFGINATRNRTVREWQHHMLCLAPSLGGALSASDFGDLYLGQGQIALEEIDFGLPVLSENSLTARLRNTSRQKLSLCCGAELSVEATGHVMSSESTYLDLAPSQAKEIRLKYTLDWQDPDTQTLRLTISDKQTGEQLLLTPYYFGYRTDITVEQPHSYAAPQPNPDPKDPDFIVKKRNYVLSRLPRFQRMTTAEGAPSDFTLRSTCGRYEFDLMKSGVLVQIADMVASLFADQNDRLAAASMLAHQKAFSMHMGPHVALHTEITSLSALRLNAGHCYSRALIWLGIVRNLKTGRGQEVYGDRAHMLLVLGHVVGAIDVDQDDRIIFDPTLGTFHYCWDNTRFATEKEIERDLALADRMVRNRRQFFAMVKYHRGSPAGQIVFPQGAVPD